MRRRRFVADTGLNTALEAGSARADVHGQHANNIPIPSLGLLQGEEGISKS